MRLSRSRVETPATGAGPGTARADPGVLRRRPIARSSLRQAQGRREGAETGRFRWLRPGAGTADVKSYAAGKVPSRCYNEDIRTEPGPHSSASPARLLLVRAVLPCVCLLAWCAIASAQTLPTGPLTTAGGRLTIGADGAVAVAPDDEAYFNASSYGYDLLRQLRGDVSATFRVGSRVSLLGDLRLEAPIGDDDWTLRPYALFARIRPLADRDVDVQAGLIPPVFGAFSRRSYSTDNPLIGFPLAYQYLTSLRPDALPSSADSLLALRGHGWLTAYPIGSVEPDHGVPLVDGLHYQTGVEVRAGNEPIQVSAALTSGTLSTPEVREWTAPQVSGRLQWKHGPALQLGVSASRGRFVSRSVTDPLGATATGTNDQRALGFDAEYSRGHWLVRTEGVWSSWRLPTVRAPLAVGQGPQIVTPLDAFALDVETRYRLTPAFSVAARLDRLGFSRVTGSAGTMTWDSNVHRAELGGGYYLQRNLLLKAAYQYNHRDSGYEPVSHLVSAQLMFWF